MYKYNVSGFSDFCSYYASGEEFYFVDGRLKPSLDLLTSDSYLPFNFWFDCKKEIEEAIKENLYMFDIKETNSFYYPNDNMFSRSNAEYNIKGYILKLKKKYLQNAIAI